MNRWSVYSKHIYIYIIMYIHVDKHIICKSHIYIYIYTLYIHVYKHIICKSHTDIYIFIHSMCISTELYMHIHIHMYLIYRYPPHNTFRGPGYGSPEWLKARLGSGYALTLSATQAGELLWRFFGVQVEKRVARKYGIPKIVIVWLNVS